METATWILLGIVGALLLVAGELKVSAGLLKSEALHKRNYHWPEKYVPVKRRRRLAWVLFFLAAMLALMALVHSRAEIKGTKASAFVPFKI